MIIIYIQFVLAVLLFPLLSVLANPYHLPCVIFAFMLIYINIINYYYYYIYIFNNNNKINI